MKKSLLMLLLIPIIGLSQERYHKDLVEFNKSSKLFLLKETKEPINGIVFIGKKYVKHELTIIDGEAVSCVGYYKNGYMKHEGIYTNIINEFRKEYHKDGLLYSEENWENNLRHGISILYSWDDEKLIKIEEGNYINGKKDGLWKYYKWDGSGIKKEILFENGGKIK